MLLEQARESLISELTGIGNKKLKNTPVTFSINVERVAAAENCSLIEALAFLAEQYSLDPDQIPKLITVGLRQKLGLENGMIKESQRVM